MDKLELKKTADGSNTLYLPAFDETYHSIHGALQEALHVFIEAGLKQVTRGEISLLEIGFGTGLNCLLTLRANEELKKEINYIGIEAFPVSLDLIRQLNYPSLLDLDQKQTLAFEYIHACPWSSEEKITAGFNLCKEKKKFEEIRLKSKVDVIYFDAFGARIQPELWGEEMMTIMYTALKPEGFLVTYGAKGSFKRALKSVGFEVENLPGPPGKREMTRAWKR